MKKVFVGTMSCGEGDFASCCKAIASQKGIDVEHLVIENLPEKQAHNTLWAAWRERQSTHDLFVKVDADTVLKHDSVLIEVMKLMEENPRVTGVQAPLHDYFTDSFINGLNCFSPKVTFKDSGDDLFCDRQVDVDHDIVLGSTQVPPQLQPAGLHCHESTEIQAFHFGVHRALKGQQHIIERVRHAWTKNKDKLRGLVILGAQFSSQLSKNRRFNYGDKELKDVFDRALSTYNGFRG